MATDNGGSARDIAGKMFLPLVVAAGSALGYLLTKKQDMRAPKLREAVSDLPRPHMPEGGVGDLAGDLRGKVESVLGKEPSAGSPSSVDAGELQQRRRARQERRDSRRQRSRR